MTVLAKKTNKPTIIITEFFIGLLIALGALVALPILVFTLTDGLVKEPLAWIVVIAAAVFFAGMSFLLLINPYLRYRRLPDILIEADGEYLYLHGKKEAKLRLADMEGAFIFAAPENLFIQVVADGYGIVHVEPLNGEKYKFHFVENANTVPKEMLAYIEKKL